MARSDAVPHAHPTDRLVGQAPAIEALRAQSRHLAAFDTVGSAFVPTLLLHGETGTGKGLVARVIHDSGPRAQGPFVEVNCAAIPESLLEAELFGFEAGTFTDAKRAKPGLVESAAHGTLFLDEIDALPVLLQAKLLSVLEEKRVRRLGAVASRQLDVKFIAATPTELSMRVAEGRFRPDLYHRLAVVLLEIPPLRERGADILVLAQHFLRQYAAAHGLPPPQVSCDAEAWLRDYDWPGNVRELSHLMERVTLFSTQGIVTAALLEQLCLPRPLRAVRAAASPIESAEAPLDEPARIRQALDQAGGNVVQAARLLGLNRGALRYRMRQYGIQRPRRQTLTPPHGSQEQAASEPFEADRGRSTSVEIRTLVSAWEQKPIVVLALDVTWPEAMHRHTPHADPWTLARRWHQTVAEKIQGFGGHIVQSAPAPLTAVFGVPQTLEQMPQRAVQAALAIRHQLAENHAADNRLPGPAVRMAVHLGEVLVDVQASDPTARLLPMEETLSLPVRLLGHATPGDILLSPQVARLVEGWFELHGRQGPAGTDMGDGVGAYAVVGLGTRCSPLEVYGKRPLSRFVGRERELATLRELLAQGAHGRGQVVGLVGEPGVGKSRLCYELTQAQRPHHWLILESSPVAYGKDKHLLRSSRRNVSPVELIDGPFLMRHKHLAGTLVERREIAQTSSRTNGVLHHPPEAFDRVEVMSAVGWQEMEAQLLTIVVEGRVELMRPMDPAPIDDHHHLFAGFAEDRHHLMEILPQLLGIKVRHDFVEDFGGPILDRPNDTEQHATRDTAPGARAHPRLPFEGLLAFDLPLAQREYQEASTLGGAPPARAGQGKAPHDRFVFIEQDDLTATCAVLEGGKCERAVGEISWGGSQATSGAVVAQILFF
jgi:DNA-binding NtrC family response regulator/class 3 adenylate cyclase